MLGDWLHESRPKDPHSSEDNARLEEIRSDFKKYVKYMLAGSSFPYSWVHDVVCDRVNEAIFNFKSVEKKRTRTSLQMPPRHGKTLLICDFLLTYAFGRFPDARCLYATYNEDFASERKEAVEMILSSEEYRILFPKALTRDTIEDIQEIDKSKRKLIKNTVRKITNVQSMHGYLEFAGRGTRTTGKGYDIIVVDDPYKGYAEAASLSYAESIKKWFKGTVMTRLESHTGNMMFLIYTRWVHDDIVGMLEEYERGNEDNNYVTFKKYIFPAEMNLEKSDYDKREEGELLIPDMAPEYAFAKKDRELWMAMYQQQPLDMIYALMKLSWFPRHISNMGMSMITIVVDSTFREKTTGGDRTAIGAFGLRGNKGFLIEVINRKMDFPEQLAMIVYMIRKYPVWSIVIETKANGDALLSSLRQKFGRCVGVEPLGKSKKERAQMVLPMLEGGFLSLPDRSICPNIDEVITQIVQFTGEDGKQDDIVDIIIYYLSYIEKFVTSRNVTIGRIEDPLAKRFAPLLGTHQAGQRSRSSRIMQQAARGWRNLNG